MRQGLQNDGGLSYSAVDVILGGLKRSAPEVAKAIPLPKLSLPSWLPQGAKLPAPLQAIGRGIKDEAAAREAAEKANRDAEAQAAFQQAQAQGMTIPVRVSGMLSNPYVIAGGAAVAGLLLYKLARRSKRGR